ncbi:MAG: Histidinol-phosphate aminotransferase [Hyphomicrobiaceae bacterium hypho_1]
MRHGGDISSASKAHDIKGQIWLDLSTGIAPNAYPLPSVPLSAWQMLPQNYSIAKLLESARYAYNIPNNAGVIAAPGTQILIQLLPLLYSHSRHVRILGPTYSEHAICWKRYVKNTQTVVDIQRLTRADVRVITNPNNPDGRVVGMEKLMKLAELSYKDNQLTIIDEAFADVAPELSIIPYSGNPGLIVLRSFGKFYGLAGLRLGFAIGPVDAIQRLEATIGPWAISGPACEIATLALRDDTWACNARARYQSQAEMLDIILSKYGFKIIGGTSLFRLGYHYNAEYLHTALARQGIWTRKFARHPFWLRFGLPGYATNFTRFESALARAQSAL